MSEPRTTIVLLAGGRATRLPGKLMLPVAGEPMLLRAYRRLRADADRPVVISARAPLPEALSARLGCPVVFDDESDLGPLQGLACAAGSVRTPLFFAAAGDMPDIDEPFVARLEAEYDAASAGGRRPAAVLPTWKDGRVEPLAALYETAAFLLGARSALKRGQRKVTDALSGLAVRPYRVQAGDERALANINTSAEYERIRT